MMKIGEVVFLLILSSFLVSASNDAFITIDSGNTGLCYSLGSLDDPVCNGGIIRVNGTSDHDLYIVNGGMANLDINVSDMNSTKTDTFLQSVMVDPLYLGMGLFGFVVFMIIFVGGGYFALCFIASNIPGLN
jgi:hypothetical protein